MSSCHAMSTEISKSPRIIKAGLLKRYKKGFLSKGFKIVYVELVDNSYFLWYRDQSRYKREGAILLSSICDFLAVGPFTRSIPGRPNLPKGASERHVIAIPSVPSRNAAVHWFLCHNDTDLNLWMTSINSVLPPLPPPSDPPPESADLSDPPPPYPGGTDEVNVKAKDAAAPSLDVVSIKVPNGEVNEQKQMTKIIRSEEKSSDFSRAAGAVALSAWGWTWGWGGGWGCGGWGCFDFGPLPNNQMENNCVDVNEGFGMRNGDVQTNSNDGGMSEQPYDALDYDQPDVDPGYDVICDGGFDAGFDAGGFDLGFSVGF